VFDKNKQLSFGWLIYGSINAAFSNVFWCLLKNLKKAAFSLFNVSVVL
jgi:hypothetical protein